MATHSSIPARIIWWIEEPGDPLWPGATVHGDFKSWTCLSIFKALWQPLNISISGTYRKYTSVFQGLLQPFMFNSHINRNFVWPEMEIRSLFLLCWKYIKKNVTKNLGHCDTATGLNIPLVKIQQPCLLSLAYTALHRNLCNLFSLEISVIFRPKQIVSIFRNFYLTLLNLFSETFWWFLMYGFCLFSYLIIFLNHLAIF